MSLGFRGAGHVRLLMPRHNTGREGNKLTIHDGSGRAAEADQAV